MEQRFCYHCGAQIAPGGRFCSACGTSVLRAAPAPVPVEEPDPIIIEDIPEVVPPTVFSLDDFHTDPVEPVPQPEPVPESAPAVLTLDELLEDPAAEPVPEPVAPIEIPVAPPVAQPVEPVPQYIPVPRPVPAPAPAPVKGILVRRGVGRTILAVLLCIVIFLWSFVTLSLINVRLATNGDQTAVTIESALRSLDLTEISASDVIVNADEDLSLAQWILMKADQIGAVPVRADEDDLQEFLENSQLIPFLSQRLSEAVSDVYQGNGRKFLSAEDIEDFLLDNRDDIEEMLGQEINRDTAGKIADRIEESGMLDKLSTRVLKTDMPAVYTVLNLGLSWWVLGGLCLVLLLLILLLGKINRSILRTCRDAGIVLMVAAGIWGIAGLFALVLPSVLESIFSFFPMAGPIVGSLLQSFLIPTAAAFGLGVVLLLIGILGKKIVFARAAKQP